MRSHVILASYLPYNTKKISYFNISLFEVFLFCYNRDFTS